MAKIRSESYWYDYVDINTILKATSNGDQNYHVIEAASQDNLHTLQRVSQAFTALTQNPLLQAAVIPINLGNAFRGIYTGSHWVGLVNQA